MNRDLEEDISQRTPTPRTPTSEDIRAAKKKEKLEAKKEEKRKAADPQNWINNQGGEWLN